MDSILSMLPITETVLAMFDFVSADGFVSGVMFNATWIGFFFDILAVGLFAFFIFAIPMYLVRLIHTLFR